VLVLLVLRVEITGLLALLQLIIPRYRLLSLVFYYSCRLEIVQDMIYNSWMAFDFVMAVDTK
jgi:hypothetical protein